MSGAPQRPPRRVLATTPAGEVVELEPIEFVQLQPMAPLSAVEEDELRRAVASLGGYARNAKIRPTGDQ